MPDSGSLFAAPSLSLTLAQARAFGAGRVAECRPGEPAPSTARRPKPLGPPHLRVVENDFLKPTTRAKGARTVEQDDTLPAGVLTGDWE
jgi:hypothetical protein